MSISKSFFQILNEKIKNNFIDKYINKIIFYNKSDFFLCFGKNSKLFISLNNSEPFFTTTDYKLSISSIITPFALTLKSEISELKVSNMELLNNDRILSLKLIGRNELYKDITRYLIIELFTNHSNAILSDENMHIISAYRYNDLNSKRIILKGVKYELPKITYRNSIESSFNKYEIDYIYHIHDVTHQSIEEIGREVIFKQTLYKDDEVYLTVPLTKNTKEISPQDIFTYYFKEAYYKRMHDKYRELLIFIKKQITTSSKRITQLEKDYQKTNDKLSYRQIGDLILTYQYPLGIDDTTTVTIDGYTFNIDRNLSMPQNAKMYYDKYQKAKKAIKVIEQSLNKNKEELAYFSLIQEQIISGSEEEILEIIEELKEEGYLKSTSKNKVPNKKTAPSAPHFITFQGIKIGFGRNNRQNDELTHHRAKKNDWFFHTKDHPGAHIIVFSEILNDDMIVFAAQLALFISKVEIGDVLYTQIKNVKKLSKPGLVSLTQYQSIYLKSVPDLSNYLMEASRH